MTPRGTIPLILFVLSIFSSAGVLGIWASPAHDWGGLALFFMGSTMALITGSMGVVGLVISSVDTSKPHGDLLLGAAITGALCWMIILGSIVTFAVAMICY